jgi:hypothetical protein
MDAPLTPAGHPGASTQLHDSVRCAVLPQQLEERPGREGLGSEHAGPLPIHAVEQLAFSLPFNRSQLRSALKPEPTHAHEQASTDHTAKRREQEHALQRRSTSSLREHQHLSRTGSQNQPLQEVVQQRRCQPIRGRRDSEPRYQAPILSRRVCPERLVPASVARAMAVAPAASVRSSASPAWCGPTARRPLQRWLQGWCCRRVC